MNTQMRLYCGLALVTTMCATAFGLYERDEAFKQSHLNGVLHFQNTTLKEQVNELEGKTLDAQRRAAECKTKR